MENPDKFQPFDAAFLERAGLNLQAVFNVADLPADMAQSIGNNCAIPPISCRQVILIGHAGTKLWECVKQSGIDSENPIDDFTVRTLKDWFSSRQPGNAFEIIYPGNQGVGLQRFGQQAGWHRPSPFMVGIDPEWGTWYAYRALIVADTAFEPTRAVESESPCEGCTHRVCISSCPGAALEGGRFDLGKCVSYRKLPESRCRATCVARVACPVGSEHRYCDEQMRHTYSISLETILRHY